MTLQSRATTVVLVSADAASRECLAGLLTDLGYEVCDAGDESADRAEVVILEAIEADAHPAAVASLLDRTTPPALIAWGAPPSRACADAWVPARPTRECLAFAIAAALRQTRSHLDIANLTARLAEAETELNQLRPLAVVGEAASGLNHDINNPLCSVSLNAQLLLMTLESRLEERFLEKLRSIEANADRIKTLTQRFASTKREALGKLCEESTHAS